MLVSRVYNHLREKVWYRAHLSLCSRYRNSFSNSEVTIISTNCTGGILYHDLGLEFLSPTINLYFRAEDFLKFCENMNYYLSIDEMVECNDPSIIGSRQYPIAYLGDLLIFLVHYDSVTEAQEKWNKRKRRMNYKKIVILSSDRDGMTEELKDRFERLPYKKIMFVHNPDKKHSNTFYIKGYEEEECVGIITDHIGWKGKRPIDQFDWVAFLNQV